MHPGSSMVELHTHISNVAGLNKALCMLLAIETPRAMMSRPVWTSISPYIFLTRLTRHWYRPPAESNTASSRGRGRGLGGSSGARDGRRSSPDGRQGPGTDRRRSVRSRTCRGARTGSRGPSPGGACPLPGVAGPARAICPLRAGPGPRRSRSGCVRRDRGGRRGPARAGSPSGGALAPSCSG